MPTQPDNNNPCDPVSQQERQDFLDQLYRASGRDRKDHPMNALYSGLFQEWTAEANDASA